MVRRVDLLDESKMVNCVADGGNFPAAIKPILRVQVLEALHRNLPEWEISAQTDQSIDIPSVQPFFPRQKVVLLSHAITLTQVRVPGLLQSQVPMVAAPSRVGQRPESGGRYHPLPGGRSQTGQRCLMLQ
jgi:hypothetical protein